MSTSPELDLDLEKLFLPSWAQEAPSANKYANFKGEDRGDRDDRRDRRGGPRPPRRDFGGGGGPPKGRQEGRPQGRFEGRGQRQDAPPPRREPVQPLPEVAVTFLPTEQSAELLARQIRVTGRAYPLFDIARLLLQKPERYEVRLETVKKGDTVAQPLFLCALDDTLWLSEGEAVAHILGKHFATFYQAERTAIEPPKGTYTFVAQCGMSGAILGPPNYHDYQNQLRKLHAERFDRMPFDMFKARVKIVRDEAVVKKWIEDQSFRTEFICLNVPEPKRLLSREAVEKDFREVHLANLVKQVEAHTLTGEASRNVRSQGLQRLLRIEYEEQRRFPLRLAGLLSQQLASHGLQFFKVQKSITHVSVARPTYLDLDSTPVSEQIRRIVDFINASPKCTRRKLIEALAPTPAPAAAATPAPEGSTPVAAAPQENPDVTALTADLHWLIHQGHIIEFANGVLETAKKPLPRPVKPAPAQPAPATPAPAQVPAPTAAVEPAAVESIAAPMAEEASPPPTSEVVAEVPPAPAETVAAPADGAA